MHVFAFFVWRSHLFLSTPSPDCVLCMYNVQINYRVYSTETILKSGNKMKCVLNRWITRTDYIQPDRKAFDWNCWNLTLVRSCVAFLSPFNLHGPFVYFAMVCRLESLICCIGVRSHCQNVDVSVPDPRYL